MTGLSERLLAVAALCEGAGVLADVGTDHGYVPVFLATEGKIGRAIAMDVNPGPLERAREHIEAYGVGDYIQTRLSDGVSALAPGEADTILIAGMGGPLMMNILKKGEDVCHRAKNLVLQPQSKLSLFRRFLAREGYMADAGNIIEEGGRFYPMMRVHYDPERVTEEGRPDGMDRWDEVCFRYGRLLISQQNPVLLEYLRKERGVQEAILERLKGQEETEQIIRRIREVEDTLAVNGEALRCFGVS